MSGGSLRLAQVVQAGCAEALQQDRASVAPRPEMP